MFDELSSLLFDACVSHMGEQAVYYPKGGGQSFSLSGVFTREYQLIQEGSLDSTVSSVDSAFEVAKNSCSPRADDRLKIREDLYRIVEIKPNGVGQVKLILKKAAGVA